MKTPTNKRTELHSSQSLNTVPGDDMNMLQFTGSKDNDPKVMEWIADHQHELGKIAAHWFKVIRMTSTDVTELMHDGYLTACFGDFPFAYVGAFKSHVNVGFFYGAELPDPNELLQGSGKRMRHVKVKSDIETDSDALHAIITYAYHDIKTRAERSSAEC